jgi:hypothetical protein
LSVTISSEGKPDISAAIQNASKSTINVGAIAGGVVGGAFVTIIIVWLVVFFLRRNKKAAVRAAQGTHPGQIQPPSPAVKPFYVNGTPPPIPDQKPNVCIHF